MGNEQIQFKYLDAGAKSSPVIIDLGLSTGNERTIYIYHLKRNQIIEYQREIVSSKLRNLQGDESGEEAALLSGYQKVRTGFTPRGAAPLGTGKETSPKAATTPIDDAEEYDEDFTDDEALPEEEM